MKLFSALFSKAHASKTDLIYRDWDRLRANAVSSSELAEIDAIFSRAL
jgi:hypothetical protein